MKRILILIKGLGRGGAEHLIASAARYRDTGRFEYEIAYLLPWKDDLVPELEAMGVRSHCLDGARGISWTRRLRALVRRHQIDLLHVHSPVAAAGARLALPRRQRIPIVYTEHNVWRRYHRATYWANAITFPRCDRVFTVSHEVRSSIRYPKALRLLPMPPVETLHHGIDPAALKGWQSIDGVRAALGIADDAPVVGTIANFKASKDYPNLLRAAVEVRREVPDVRFVFIGRGPLEEETRRLVREMGLDGTVVFAGFRPDAPRVAAAIDVFALASLHEGLSIALLEAMALGKPPVVTRVGGLPEVIEHGKHGLLVPPERPDILATSITSLLTDASLRARLGEAARRRAADFDIRAAVRRMEQVYTELL